jgi:hypothetical protein
MEIEEAFSENQQGWIDNALAPTSVYKIGLARNTLEHLLR